MLSVPERIRPFFHQDPALVGAVLRVLLRAIRTALRRGSPRTGPDAQIGAVPFLHRFGAALNPRFHFHLVVLDGVFTEIDDGVRFQEATHFSAHEAAGLAPILQRRGATEPLVTRGSVDVTRVPTCFTLRPGGYAWPRSRW